MAGGGTTVLDVPVGDGAQLSVQVGGAAGRPWLVLLQGQARSHGWWSRLRTRWEGQFRTLTLDYRGTGATTDRGGPLSTRLLAADVVAVLDAVVADRAHVYGTSMGGRVAQMLAVDHPRRVASLVLAGTSPGGPYAVAQDPRVTRSLSVPDRATLRAVLADLFYTPDWRGAVEVSTLLGDETMTPADRQRHRRMSAEHDAWPLLPRIGCPTLIMHGAHDEMTPPGNARLLARRIPGARTYLHPRGRHGFFDEFADDTAKVLAEFWTDVGVTPDVLAPRPGGAPPRSPG